VIREPADLQKLRWPEIAYGAQATEQSLAGAQDLFGDILEAKLKGVAHPFYHPMSQLDPDRAPGGRLRLWTTGGNDTLSCSRWMA
jgi:hypothetical protein